MGESRRREEASLAAADAMRKILGNGTGAAPPAEVAKKQFRLTPNQAAVFFCLQRIVQAISIEAGQLNQVYGQREAAGELAAAADHLTKFQVRFLADCEKSIQPATPEEISAVTKQ